MIWLTLLSIWKQLELRGESLLLFNCRFFKKQVCINRFLWHPFWVDSHSGHSRSILLFKIEFLDNLNPFIRQTNRTKESVLWEKHSFTHIVQTWIFIGFYNMILNETSRKLNLLVNFFSINLPKQVILERLDLDP